MLGLGHLCILEMQSINDSSSAAHIPSHLEPLRLYQYDGNQSLIVSQLCPENMEDVSYIGRYMTLMLLFLHTSRDQPVGPA